MRVYIVAMEEHLTEEVLRNFGNDSATKNVVTFGVDDKACSNIIGYLLFFLGTDNHC